MQHLEPHNLLLLISLQFATESLAHLKMRHKQHKSYHVLATMFPKEIILEK